jgi:dTDP-4-amino-4,6-dideoxygalactose transaminase
MNIKFNRPCVVGNELGYIAQAIKAEDLAGDGHFSKKCQTWFNSYIPNSTCLLTPSCTHALEMAAILLNIKPGDEVIMPSYTFVSTANAFVLRGAKIIFVDIRPDTMNIDENLIESSITDQTRAIVVVHYAGVACEMERIVNIAAKYGIYIVEDAAQGFMASYHGQPLGSIGDIGVFSFHATKNYTSGGEGGLLIVNNPDLAARAEIIREKGTNRSQFFRGSVDKYTWIDIGSSYLPSELQAAYLWGQIEMVDHINQNRLETWNKYFLAFRSLEVEGKLELANIPGNLEHNAHMFYIKLKDLDERARFIDLLSSFGITSAFHYIPLHSSPAGELYGELRGKDVFTTRESERLVRLPMYYGMSVDEQEKVVSSVKEFFF